MIVAVVLIVLALVYYLVSTILQLRAITTGLDEVIAGVSEIVEKSKPVNGIVTAINRVPANADSAITSAYDRALHIPPGSSSTVCSAPAGPDSTRTPKLCWVLLPPPGLTSPPRMTLLLRVGAPRSVTAALSVVAESSLC